MTLDEALKVAEVIAFLDGYLDTTGIAEAPFVAAETEMSGAALCGAQRADRSIQFVIMPRAGRGARIIKDEEADPAWYTRTDWEPL